MTAAQSIADYHFLKLNEELLQDPYPFYKQLRESGPVCRESDYGVYLVGTLDAIREVNRQPEVFSSILVANAPYVELPCPLPRARSSWSCTEQRTTTKAILPIRSRSEWTGTIRIPIRLRLGFDRAN